MSPREEMWNDGMNSPQRDLPLDPKGEVDEWAAMIQKQTDLIALDR